jgi:hypothetical protein
MTEPSLLPLGDKFHRLDEITDRSRHEMFNFVLSDKKSVKLSVTRCQRLYVRVFTFVGQVLVVESPKHRFFIFKKTCTDLT